MLSSQPESGSPYLKSLPPWEELDYFRRPRALRGRRGWFTVTLFALGMLFALWSILPANHSAHQAAPVSVAHAPFGQDCSTCHLEHFQPIARLVHGGGLPSVSNDTCNSCHHGATHNVQQVREPDCATCHHEHQGRALLAQVADGFCTDCHGELKRKDGRPPNYPNITGFAINNHPEFRAVEPGNTDKARLKFNHALHLGLDLKALRDQGRPVQDRYGGALECAACHEPDAERRYMKPISYQTHCQSCHPLTVQLAGQFQDADTQQAADAFRKIPAPHDTPEVVQGVLLERLVAFAQKHAVVPGAASPPEPERAIPGRSPRPPSEQEWTWAKGQLRTADELLFVQKELPRMEKPLSGSQCVHCHYPKEPAPNGLPHYEPTKVPDRWFVRSVFRHDSHRMLQCVQCHGKAPTSTQTSDVLLPGIQTCIQCHHPGNGARSDCIACHQYHDRALERGFNGRFTIQEVIGH